MNTITHLLRTCMCICWLNRILVVILFGPETLTFDDFLLSYLDEGLLASVKTTPKIKGWRMCWVESSVSGSKCPYRGSGRECDDVCHTDTSGRVRWKIHIRMLCL